ncbi:MAG TPA: DUF4087 domain-containing protein [Pyrinomonadaceae bacterium]|nr:DUF4087 domain-containing protein [Pyrinomonadaceae bacterium]
MNKTFVKPGLMIVIGLLLAFAALVSAQPRRPRARAVEQSETRCGWFSNPTPANASLHDRDGEWVIGSQGGYQAEGKWPSFTSKQWVETNGHYGHGCACLRLRVNRKTHDVIKIESARARPLAACRRDRSLTKWGFK